MKKYTAEQVSRILSAAANGELGPHSGCYPPDTSRPLTYCVEQCANYTTEYGYSGNIDRERSFAWDSEMKKPRDPDATLRWLEQQGMV